jgi:hypothetical protein
MSWSTVASRGKGVSPPKGTPRHVFVTIPSSSTRAPQISLVRTLAQDEASELENVLKTDEHVADKAAAAAADPVDAVKPSPAPTDATTGSPARLPPAPPAEGSSSARPCSPIEGDGPKQVFTPRSGHRDGSDAAVRPPSAVGGPTAAAASGPACQPDLEDLYGAEEPTAVAENKVRSIHWRS